MLGPECLRKCLGLFVPHRLWKRQINGRDTNGTDQPQIEPLRNALECSKMMQCVFRPELTGFRVAFSLKHRAGSTQKQLRKYFHTSFDSTYQLVSFLRLYKETILQLSLIEPWQVSDFSIIFILRDADVINDCIAQCLRWLHAMYKKEAWDLSSHR